MNLRQTFADLWRFHPAALYAFATLIGSSCALYTLGLYFSIFCLFFFVFPLFTARYQRAHLRLLLALVLGIACFFFTSARYRFPAENSLKTGIADVEITTVKLNQTPFGIMWHYKGTLKTFIQNGQSLAKDIPVLISIPFDTHASRPIADFRYLITGRLKTTAHGKYVLNPVKNEAWQPQEKLNSLAEWRYSAKSALQRYIQGSVKSPHVGAFLSGIATGDFDDRLLAFKLGRFGLQHLMAISGLHFSILSTLVALLLGLFFSRNQAALITLGLMSGYFIFLGTSASVARAWIAIMIGIASLFVQRRNFAFNALGAGALIVILCDPLSIEEPGFQFSFGITAAILLWFSPCEIFLQRLFSKRSLSEVTRMDYWDQHGYCLLYFLRQSLALCLAVNLVALPLTLYHFQAFPLMGLVYNLFFPFLVSLSLIILVPSCIFSLIFPWFGSHLHSLNEAYTQFVLNFAFNLPRSFDVIWKVDGISKEMLLLYLLTLLITGMLLKQRMHARQLSI